MDEISVREPARRTEWERAEFERLVREGFDGSDASLPERIHTAHRLAIRRAADGTVIAIAGLKAPSQSYRDEVFARTGAPAGRVDHSVELGWVYVIPERRGQGLGEAMCRRLLHDLRDAPVFALTRPGNRTMIRILEGLGFDRVGRPFPRPERNEELALFLRGGHDDPARGGAARRTLPNDPVRPDRRTPRDPE